MAFNIQLVFLFYVSDIGRNIPSNNLAASRTYLNLKESLSFFLHMSDHVFQQCSLYRYH